MHDFSLAGFFSLTRCTKDLLFHPLVTMFRSASQSTELGRMNEEKKQSYVTKAMILRPELNDWLFSIQKFEI